MRPMLRLRGTRSRKQPLFLQSFPLSCDLYWLTRVLPLLSCVYDTTIPTLYSFALRSTPSCPRERAGVLHAARPPAQDRAAHRAPPRAPAPDQAPAQAALAPTTGARPRNGAWPHGVRFPPTSESLEAAELLPIGDGGFERPELRARVVQVVIDDLRSERLARER